ncbi:hypothetical protein P153DRAFT_147059 [Dothidotthia symphoricarpi CBS 119687]|uniref:Uncharacterized protein n=1 Tax=Dothidotthia symphoricarpi CBS 119687 TaxID=1392245 RepID=A0A6A5ZWB4_9PLEO|nr:uncharacterized protein P153DRAFT_147059 [Dothidotthia symphoricarpi CBS 119687]KAF2123819.1 hypothetical protein P153DRAFT_147059 [Dothidotthia symphoricarpi CBS 119687]
MQLAEGLSRRLRQCAVMGEPSWWRTAWVLRVVSDHDCGCDESGFQARWIVRLVKLPDRESSARSCELRPNVNEGTIYHARQPEERRAWLLDCALPTEAMGNCREAEMLRLDWVRRAD